MYVWLDATYVHVRDGGPVVSKAVVIATGLRADGHREVLRVNIGDSENETFRTEFLRSLKDRNLLAVARPAERPMIAAPGPHHLA